MTKDFTKYFNSTASMIEFALLYAKENVRIQMLGLDSEFLDVEENLYDWVGFTIEALGANADPMAIREVKIIYLARFGRDYDEVRAERIAEKEQEKAEAEKEQEKPTAPKIFKVGDVAKAMYTYQSRDEKVVKVSKCYIWITYCGQEDELVRKKIRKDMDGNEYVEWNEGKGFWYGYRAA